MNETNNTSNTIPFLGYYVVVVACTHCGYNNNAADIDENELGIVECSNCGFGFTPGD
jgi:predicted nucleic-acid-binding Zn-ribbon protein